MKNPKLLLIAALISLAALPAMAQLNDTYVIAASGNSRGAFGTHWMTRFTIFNPHLDSELKVSVSFLPTGGAPGPEKLITLPANSMAFSENILDDLYGIEGSGSLLVATFADDNPDLPDDVLSRSFLVTTDTFNNHPSGTYGQTIPGVWAGLLDYDSDGISSVAPNVRNGGNWRTNVGAVNLGSCAVNLRVNVYDGDGNTILNQAPLPIPPYGHNQAPLPVAIAVGSVEFFVDDPCAADDERYAVVFPYTSTIDNRTGDPTYLTPTLLAEPGILFAKGQKVDPTQLGKKIDSAYARTVRDHAVRTGTASLKREATGWRITQ
ncbi:MAG TPA: hypothetical protein VFV49_06570 [Thermoanaerobaculia bacterium]|nr:hypothetical protein [Thermoanaerobaculia bacterium]